MMLHKLHSKRKHKRMLGNETNNLPDTTSYISDPMWKTHPTINVTSVELLQK